MPWNPSCAQIGCTWSKRRAAGCFSPAPTKVSHFAVVGGSYERRVPRDNVDAHSREPSGVLRDNKRRLVADLTRHACESASARIPFAYTWVQSGHVSRLAPWCSEPSAG